MKILLVNNDFHVEGKYFLLGDIFIYDDTKVVSDRFVLNFMYNIFNIVDRKNSTHRKFYEFNIQKGKLLVYDTSYLPSIINGRYWMVDDRFVYNNCTVVGYIDNEVLYNYLESLDINDTDTFIKYQETDGAGAVNELFKRLLSKYIKLDNVRMI